MRLSGIPVYLDSLLVRSIGWKFPQERFFEWEPKDEWLCRRLGIGHEEFEYQCYRVGNAFYMHPKVWQQLKKELPEICEEEPLRFYSNFDQGPIVRPSSFVKLATV